MYSRNKTAAAVTVGCRLNQADTALIFGRLRDAGYEIVEPDSEGPIGVIIINSCAVTASASQKSRQYVRACRRKHPEAKIIVTGCESEVEKEFWKSEKAVDIYLPNTEKTEILDHINGKSPEQKTANKKVFMEKTTGFYPFRSRAFIKVQEGCEAFCTYCIVPYARGPERSRDHKEIICEFRNLLEQGFKEIILTGVNISTYRDGKLGLSELLTELLDIEGDFRIRLSSTEPHLENKKLIGIMNDNLKLCRFLHLPLQHGADEILKLMGRKYSTEDFADFAEEAISSVPGIHLGTDVICGFPGETEKLFEKSCRFIESIPFANLHVFSFSPRKRTPAASYADKVQPKLVKERHRKLEDIDDNLANKFLDSQLGETLRILIEKVHLNGDVEGLPAYGGSKGNFACEGWSDNYIRVVSKLKDAKAGSFADVLALERSGNVLLAEHTEKT